MSWCIHDAIELEKRGIPTITICTDEFVSLGRMEAQTLMMPQLPIVAVPHPLGGLKPEEVAKKARIAFDAIVRLLEIG